MKLENMRQLHLQIIRADEHNSITCTCSMKFDQLRAVYFFNLEQIHFKQKYIRDPFDFDVN